MVRARDSCWGCVDLHGIGYLLVRDDSRRGKNSLSCLQFHCPHRGLRHETIQVMTGEPPFKHIQLDTSVPKAITEGQRPERPTDLLVERRGLDDQLWGLLTRCWAQNPKDRPDIFEVNKELESMRYPKQGVRRQHLTTVNVTLVLMHLSG